MGEPWTSLRLTPQYRQTGDGDGWTEARLAEVPAAITAAPTRELAERQLIDAVRELLLSLDSTP